MRASRLLSMVAALSLVSSVVSLTILPRQQVCANDGKTVAGTIFSRDLSEISSSLHVRSGSPIPCTWCQPGSATYIIITALTDHGILPNTVGHSFQREGVATAIQLLQGIMQASGDTIISRGTYVYRDSWVMLRAVNANNHQLTRGVVLSAFRALHSWMVTYDVYGTAAFKIYDGANLVGEGTLELARGFRR